MMTKKEQAFVDEQLRKVRTLSALRWTEEVKPDIPIPPPGTDALTTGYVPLAAGYSGRVEPACSSSCSHGIGRIDSTNAQRPIPLYSTELLALKALRHMSELRFAEELARIDRMITEEKAK